MIKQETVHISLILPATVEGTTLSKKWNSLTLRLALSTWTRTLWIFLLCRSSSFENCLLLARKAGIVISQPRGFQNIFNVKPFVCHQLVTWLQEGKKTWPFHKFFVRNWAFKKSTCMNNFRRQGYHHIPLVRGVTFAGQVHLTIENHARGCLNFNFSSINDTPAPGVMYSKACWCRLSYLLPCRPNTETPQHKIPKINPRYKYVAYHGQRNFKVVC